MIETTASVARRHVVSARPLAVISAALFVFVFLYRFNTLGGALAGFDDDHFVHFAYAKQVQGGEQPLRDFAGLGLQGARPALTFELSSAAQSLLGNNLRSEALLTVGAMAAGAVVTFLGGSLVARIPWSLGATLLSVFLAPKLYNYPKVIVLAAGSALIACYARRPALGTVSAMAALTAAAFLFRHDYAVYVGVGTAAACAAAAGSIRRAALHATMYAVIALALLTPSLLFVQHHAGLVAYMRDSLAQSEYEAHRTDLPWPSFVLATEAGRRVDTATFFGVEQNAVSWLYYLHLALAPLMLSALWRTRLIPWPEARPALGAIAVMTLVVAPLFLRGNPGARFGDLAPLSAVLLAGGCTIAFRWRTADSFWMWSARSALAGAVLAATVQSVWTVGSVASELDASGWSDSAEKIVGQARRRWSELEALPAAYWTGKPATASIRAVQYLHRCTRPSDRVVMISYQPEILPLADRRFGAGRASLVPELLTGEHDQRSLIDRWSRQSVPIVLVEDDPEYAREIPLVRAYLSERYAAAGTLEIDGGDVLKVLARRDLTPTGTFTGTPLPCFQ